MTRLHKSAQSTKGSNGNTADAQHKPPQKTTKTGVVAAILVRASTAFAKNSNVDPFLMQPSPRHIALVITPDVPCILDEKTAAVTIRSAPIAPPVDKTRKPKTP